MGSALAVQISTPAQSNLRPGAVIAAAIQRERATLLNSNTFRSQFVSAEALQTLFQPSRWARLKVTDPSTDSIIPCLTYLACQAMKLRMNHNRGRRTGVKKAEF